MTILLTILKILGITLLVLLGILLVLVTLVVFVPVRYQIKIRRKETEGIPAAAEIRITWLLHILNAAFSYPEAAYIKVRIFCFTLFCSDKSKEKTKGKDTANKKKESRKPDGKTPVVNKEAEDSQSVTDEKKEPQAASAADTGIQNAENNASEKLSNGSSGKVSDDKSEEPSETAADEKSIKEKFVEFFSRLLAVIKNIRYTILQICDKIKHIVNNIQYYVDVIKSDVFGRTWKLCTGQLSALFKSIRPRKFTGKLLIGMGDPASTGQILAIYGILYPLLGSHIEVAPDFERKVLEGELFIKGKITVFRFLKTAWIVYFNKDLRRLMKLLKREAA